MEPYQEQLDELTALLGQAITHHRRLLNLLQAEQEAVIAARPETLAAVTEQKAILIQALRDVECRRIKLMGRMASILGQSGQDLSLKRLAAAVEPPAAGQLLAIRRQLARLIDDIRRENRINQALLGDSLRFVRSTLQHMRQLIQPHSVYSQDGQVCGRGTGGKVIQGQI
jgi:flagellar biosynthesis/type III secretory pathway chaperone